MIRELEQDLSSKKQRIEQLKADFAGQEQKWREKVKVFEGQMKEKYVSKLKRATEEMQKECNHVLKMQNQVIASQQAQIENLQESKEAVQRYADEITKEQISKMHGQYQNNESEWLKEREYLLRLIKEMQAKLEQVQVELQRLLKENLALKDHRTRSEYTQHTVSDLGATTLDFKSRLDMISKNTQLNHQIKQKCTDILNKEFDLGAYN